MTTWISPTGFVDSGGTWINEANAYDTDTNTLSYCPVQRDSWGDFLEVTHAGVYCDRVKYWANLSSGDTFLINLDVYYNGAWVDLYSGTLAALQWVEVELGGIYEVTSARVSMKYSNGGAIAQQRLHEFYFGAIDTKIARIAFSSDPFDSTPTWSDVSSDLMNFHIRRGRQWELDKIEAGTASIKLSNINGNYWPNNITGSYTPNVKPWKRINIQMQYAGILYDLFTGYIERWEPDFTLKPIKAPFMVLQCSDGIKNISQHLLNIPAGFSQELSGTRIANVLDDIGWATTSRLLDAGQSQMQSTGALANVNALTHLATLSDSEIGILFNAVNGYMVFQDRHARLKAPYTTSQATFSDTPSDSGYSDIKLRYEDVRIYNDIRVSRLGGTEQVATSTTSQDSYGKRSLRRVSLLLTTDAESLAQAEYLKDRFETPLMRAVKLGIKPNADPSTLYPLVLGLDISARITIALSQASLNEDYHIEGIYQDWDILESSGLRTTWMLSAASIDDYWIVGTSALGSTTKLTW